MTKLSAKEKMVRYLKKQEGYNTFTTAQARRLFGIQNVGARIGELRQEGHCIYTNRKTLQDGRRITYYKMGMPTKKMVKAALRGGFSFSN